MLADDTVAGWHSVDDAPAPVPVRVNTKAPTESETTPVVKTTTVTTTVQNGDTAVRPDPRSMQLSAATGIVIVLAAMVSYFGIDTLKGVLVGENANVTTVTITEDGHFSPATVSLAGGATLTIENKNKDPQVLKIQSGKELFPVQVLFEKPFSFAVPADAAGNFIYFSETLSDTETLSITVTPALEAQAQSSSVATQQTQSSVASNEIPLPFGSGPLTPVTSSSSSVSSVTISLSPAINNNASGNSSGESNETQEFSLGGTDSGASETFQPSAIPNNPYTVGSDTTIRQRVSVETYNGEQLHSGAPLNQYRPVTVTKTGPDMWLLALMPALLGVVFVYRRMAQQA